MKMQRPSEDIIRREITLMIDCFLNELFRTFGKKEIIGVYLLGSANKKWESEIDYIPSFSDVDLNIYVNNQKKFKKYFSDMKKAVNFSKKYSISYARINPKPFHTPRLQAQLHNTFLENPEYLAPASSVKTIYGKPYAETIPKHKAKSLDVKKTISEKEKYVSEITLRVMSANEDRLERYLKEIYYKVCSTVPLVLCLYKENFDDVMTMNKTTLSKHLKRFGLAKISNNYKEMLKEANAYFLTKDIKVARKSIILGHAVLLECIRIVNQKF